MLDPSLIQKKMRVLRTLGTPMDEEIANAPKELEGKTEMDAMVTCKGMGTALTVEITMSLVCFTLWTVLLVASSSVSWSGRTAATPGAPARRPLAPGRREQATPSTFAGR